eukprot:snap_masked-scaffold_4-processed-gene-8.11-mRNA-1 protein AED:1.00 eAED:1.00 QI:0/0/0/0/1/1/2/0/76
MDSPLFAKITRVTGYGIISTATNRGKEQLIQNFGRAGVGAMVANVEVHMKLPRVLFSKGLLFHGRYLMKMELKKLE